MKQKIYEILTSPKIQTNDIILYNCIDKNKIGVARPLSRASLRYLETGNETLRQAEMFKKA